MHIYVTILYSLIFLSGRLYLCREENLDLVFTSPEKIRTLLKTQDRVTQTIDEYIKSEQDRIQRIQEYVDTWRKEYEYQETDSVNYLSDPLNLYHLLKKMTIEWKQVTEWTKNSKAEDFIKKIESDQSLTWPTSTDFDGIQNTLLNIQKIHNMKATDLARGKVGHINSNFELSYDECYQLCKKCYENLAYEQALGWGIAALGKYFLQGIKNEAQSLELMYICSWASIIKGDYEKASNYIRGYSMLKSDNITVTNMRYFAGGKQKNPPEFIIKRNQMYKSMKKLCSSTMKILPLSELRCRYNFQNSPFLRLAPLKEEILSSNPKILLFHNVIYDSEIEKLLDEALLRLHESEPHTQYAPGSVTYGKRLNEFDWFENGKFIKLDNISRRVTDMTSTPRNFVQPFQISHYGVGEYYYEHSMLQSEGTNEVKEYGKRIATVTFSLNDVWQGGATIFPQIGMKVDVARGDALVWSNVQDDGTEDTRVRHASCPVLSGYKWVLIRNINEKKQQNNQCRRN